MIMALRTMIGNRMKMIRVYANLKQKDLANSLGIPASILSLYEQGKREPTLTFISKFCEYFKISVSQFFASEHFESRERTESEIQRISSSLGTILSELEKIKLGQQRI